MSLTPGWKEKEFKSYTPGIPVTFNITESDSAYFLDNGSEYKDFPRTKTGWTDLCDELKNLEP